MVKERFGERLAVVSEALPYAHFVAENPIIANGIDVVDYFTHMAVAYALEGERETGGHPFIEEFIGERQRLYQELSGRITNGSGPLMEETTIAQDILLAPISQRYGEMPDELKKLMDNYFSPVSGIGMRLCYEMVTHHLVRPIGDDQREGFFLINDPESPNAFSEFYGGLNEQNGDLVRQKYGEWKSREKLKRDNGRSSSAEHKTTIPEILSQFSKDTGADYRGYEFKADDPKKLELGVHPTGALIDKFWLNSFR